MTESPINVKGKKYFFMDLDQFQELWQEEEEEDITPKNVPQKIEESKEYQLKDMKAKYKIFSDIMQTYFSTQYGEKISIDKFQKVDPYNINFHL